MPLGAGLLWLTVAVYWHSGHRTSRAWIDPVVGHPVIEPSESVNFSTESLILVREGHSSNDPERRPVSHSRDGVLVFQTDEKPVITSRTGSSAEADSDAGDAGACNQAGSIDASSPEAMIAPRVPVYR